MVFHTIIINSLVYNIFYIFTNIYINAAEKIPKQLAENPFVGSQLRYPFLREKQVKEKRIYYLIYDDLKLVLLVAVSGKKDQQTTIDHISSHLNEFRKAAEDISKQAS